MLLQAILQNRADEIRSRSLEAKDLAVDVSAQVVWDGNRATFVVNRVFSAQQTPRVYRNDKDRDRQYCALGSATGLEPDLTRAACIRLQGSSAK